MDIDKKIVEFMEDKEAFYISLRDHPCAICVSKGTGDIFLDIGSAFVSPKGFTSLVYRDGRVVLTFAKTEYDFGKAEDEAAARKWIKKVVEVIRRKKRILKDRQKMMKKAR